jgi:hypothetical protein
VCQEIVPEDVGGEDAAQSWFWCFFGIVGGGS